MAEINMKAVKGPELKVHIKTLNECGLLPEAIVVKPGRKNVDLASEFVAGIEATNDIGKLDAVPEEVFTYYTSIVVPGDDKKEAPAAPATKPATAGRGRGAAKAATPAAAKKTDTPPTPPAPPAEKKQTRADVFATIVKTGKPMTKAAIEEAMENDYNGSTKETGFWVSCYIRLSLSLGVMVKNEDKTYTYSG
jgi:hypothetical protein